MLSLRCQKRDVVFFLFCFFDEIIPGLFKTHRTSYFLFTLVIGLVLSYRKNSESHGQRGSWPCHAQEIHAHNELVCFHKDSRVVSQNVFLEID